MNFIKALLPAILLKTTDDKSFISNEAKLTVTNCLTNFVLPETLDIALRGCQHKNKKLAEESFVSYLKTLVESTDLTNKDHSFMADGK